MSNLAKRCFGIGYTLVAAMPLIWSVLFYYMAYHIAQQLGRWPIAMRDSTQFTAHGFDSVIDDILSLLGLGLMVLIPLWIVAFLAKFTWGDRPAVPTLRFYRLKIDLAALLFLMGISVLAVIGIWDPHHLFNWWLD